MKLPAIKKEIQKYQYFEDTSIIDLTLASIISNRLKIGDPVWLVIIGASSGGKSQILRPMALTDETFIHRVDDLTENTFLSAKAGDKKKSLLHRIGTRGIIAISDLTVLFSKNSDSKNAILSQFRMIYDGEMTKMSGNDTTANTWKGNLGVISGGTPTLYEKFEEVADMGERFIYYRMKDYDPEKATEIALNRKMYGRDLDEKLAKLYGDYITNVAMECTDKELDLELDKETKHRIVEVSLLAERIRTVAKKDWKGEVIIKKPVPAMPMRIALQLSNIAKGLMAIKFYETGATKLEEAELHILDWCAYSLANEEKRACLDVIAKHDFGLAVRTTTIADVVGLDTDVIRNILQNLSAVGILQRTGDSNSLHWAFTKESDWKVLRRICDIKESENLISREITEEEGHEGESGFDTFDENFINSFGNQQQ